MSADQERLIEKIRQLPPQRLAEVEDFVDFLLAREAAQRAVRTAACASEPSLAAVWNNDEDAAYDQL